MHGMQILKTFGTFLKIMANLITIASVTKEKLLFFMTKRYKLRTHQKLRLTQSLWRRNLRTVYASLELLGRLPTHCSRIFAWDGHSAMIGPLFSIFSILNVLSRCGIAVCLVK